MKYLCLIYSEEQKLNALSKSELDALIEEAFAYGEVLRKSGHSLVSDALQSVQTAPTVRVRNGQVSITDGPFARDQGAAGWVHPDRRQGPGRRHPSGLEAPAGAPGQRRGAADLGSQAAVAATRKMP